MRPRCARDAPGTRRQARRAPLSQGTPTTMQHDLFTFDTLLAKHCPINLSSRGGATSPAVRRQLSPSSSARDFSPSAIGVRSASGVASPRSRRCVDVARAPGEVLLQYLTQMQVPATEDLHVHVDCTYHRGPPRTRGLAGRGITVHVPRRRSSTRCSSTLRRRPRSSARSARLNRHSSTWHPRRHPPTRAASEVTPAREGAGLAG